MEINATGDVTLHTAGKYCEEDILVRVPSVTYETWTITLADGTVVEKEVALL